MMILISSRDGMIGTQQKYKCIYQHFIFSGALLLLYVLLIFVLDYQKYFKASGRGIVQRIELI